ncbi:MAG: DEAD/DEAH box helicase [Pseudomonadota bacterium]|nr:DEAD/DEAH box helicase [Pseudomonadota bacterium]
MIGHTQTDLAFGQPSSTVIVPKPVPTDWLDVLPPGAECLRDYQRQQIANVAAELHAGRRRILVQLVTGGGKTHEIGAIVEAARVADLRVLLLATRTRLVRQLHDRLDGFQIRHGVIAASLPEFRNYSAGVQVASVDTLYRRAMVANKIPLPSADVVIFDEAHLATAESRLRILESYPAAHRIGFTATPARKSGRSLDAGFESLILGPSMKALTDAGVLVPSRIFNTPIVTNAELRALPKDNDGDFKPAPAAELLSRPKLVGDVIANWLRIANGKSTILFATNKAHGAALLDAFRHQGVAAEMLTDADDEATREEVIGRLEAGDTTIVINCFLMAYGVDVPSVECVVLARPTRSLTMYLQMVGRGLRAAPGKTHCIVIDHGHVVENLGLPQTEFAWSLDPASNVNAVATKTAVASRKTTEAMRTCRECSQIWLTSEQGNACLSCGWAPMPRAKAVVVEEADLAELADEESTPSPADARVMGFFREACGWYSRQWPDRWRDTPNKGRAWAWMQTQAKFKIPTELRIPSAYWNATLAQPSDAVSGWLQYRSIQWRKSQQRRRGT